MAPMFSKSLERLLKLTNDTGTDKLSRLRHLGDEVIREELTGLQRLREDQAKRTKENLKYVAGPARRELSQDWKQLFNDTQNAADNWKPKSQPHQRTEKPLQKSSDKYDAHEIDYNEQQKQKHNQKRFSLHFFMGLLLLLLILLTYLGMTA